ncbi:MAG TPA: hypothetical protein VK633_13990 [Verrucomicrobiae bacterium]|nr:hypothetical protein [Verrucomicrobiae bacterium]
MFLTRLDDSDHPGRWLIGPYRTLDKLATALKTDNDLRKLMVNHQVRFGERAGDLPPTNARQKRINWDSERPVADHAPLRKSEIVPGSPGARNTDQFSSAETYWESQRLQAHHIVEKSNVKALGIHCAPKDVLHDDDAPAVLLTAEFHQRLFTAKMAAQRGQFHSGLTSQQALAELRAAYHPLYSRRVSAELKWLADLIIEECARRKQLVA